VAPGVLSKALDPIKRRRRRVAAALAVGLAATGLGAAGVMPDGRPTPSGYEVPRWIALSGKQAHARRGPGRDHPILWTYVAPGLPVQVIAETREWRKICDPEGSVVWVHRTVTSGRRRVFNPSTEPLPVRSGRDAAAGVRAQLAPRAVISAEDCEDGWCQVRDGRLKGWVPASAVFGTADRAQCDFRRPAGPAPG
jgi:SH3-like domain-containing protein